MKTIIAPRWLLTMHGEVQAIEGSAVLIEHHRISALGPRDQIIAQHPDATLIERPNHVLMPGLINAHAHAAMNLLRGVGDDLPLMQWLQTRIWPLEAALVSESFVHDGTVLAAAEMLLGGTTTFNDMYFYPSDAVRAAHAMGARIVSGITVIEFPTAYASDATDYLNKGLAARDEWKGEQRVHWSLAPHAPYTVSDDTFKQIATLAEQLDLPIHLHLHETAQEVEDGLSRHGMRPLARLKSLGLVNERLIAVHSVHLNEHEIEELATAGASMAHCPASNLKLASGFSPIAKAAKAGVNICIGTDGAASNNRVDMWSELRLAALLSKGVEADATSMTASQTLQAVTCNAAKALGLENLIGQIQPGFEADLIAIEIPDDSFTQPLHNLVSHLVYVSGRNSVTDTWVQGHHVVQMRQLASTSTQLISETLRNCKSLWQTRIRTALNT
jgi:5-methylthioadenosine/S-adenosylhomocysteine deaminase